MYLSLSMRSEEDFFPESFCPDEIVKEYGGNVEVPSISRALHI